MAHNGRAAEESELTSAEDAGRRPTGESSPIKLSRRSSEAFAAASVNPRPVNDRLRETILGYRENGRPEAE